MLNFFKSMVAGSGKRERLINFLQKVSNQYGIGGLMKKDTFVKLLGA